jgi:hypothetical protein
MKNIVLLLSVLISFSCLSQNSNDSNQIKVKKVVNQFFEALNKQDTILYKKIVFLEGQIWSINKITASKCMSMRFFRDDIETFNPDEIWEEIPLNFDIKIHNGIAMAWVPYEFKVNGKFTHCGIDIFTLAETNEGWKIINTSYTKYLDGCNELKN